MSSRGRSSRRTRWVLPTRSIDCSFVRIPKGILFSRLIDSPRFVTYLQFSPWFLLLVRFIIIILRSFPRPFKSCQQVLAPANQYLKEQEAKLGSGEIDLNNPLAKPRIPYEILFAIGGWSAGSPTNFVETYDTRLCLSLHTFLRLTPRNASVFISHAGIFIYFATSLQIGANRQIANYIRTSIRSDFSFITFAKDKRSSSSVIERLEENIRCTHEWSIFVTELTCHSFCIQVVQTREFTIFSSFCSKMADFVLPESYIRTSFVVIIVYLFIFMKMGFSVTEYDKRKICDIYGDVSKMLLVITTCLARLEVDEKILEISSGFCMFTLIWLR